MMQWAHCPYPVSRRGVPSGVVDGDLGSMISIMSLHLVLFGVVCTKPLRRPQLQEILSH
jgi:hypothetical protein